MGLTLLQGLLAVNLGLLAVVLVRGSRLSGSTALLVGVVGLFSVFTSLFYLAVHAAVAAHLWEYGYGIPATRLYESLVSALVASISTPNAVAGLARFTGSRSGAAK